MHQRSRERAPTTDLIIPYGVLFCMSVNLSIPPGWPLDPSYSSRPSDPTSLKRQLEGSEGLLEGSKGQQEGSEGQLVGSEGQPEGSEGHLSGFEGQPGGNGWMAKLTYGQTEVLPILQDFVPCQGRWPKRKEIGGEGGREKQ